MQTTNHSPLTSQNIAISGGGLLGCLFAWQLVLAGHRVSVFEAGNFKNPKGAAHTAAGMISPKSEVVVSNRSIYDIGLRSLELWREWIDKLPEAFQSLYSEKGTIAVAHSGDFTELLQLKRDLQFHLREDDTSEWLTQEQLKNYEPDLSDNFETALYLPHEAHLDHRPFIHKLVDWLKTQGVIFFEHSTVSFAPEPQVNGEALKDFDIILDCRGAGAKDMNAHLRGVRGEVLWVESKDVVLHRPVRLMHPRYKLYIVPKSHSRFILGATEIESEDQSPVTVQSTMEFCSALYTLNPAFAEARILEMDANLRPSLLDNMPVIKENVVPSAGGSRNIRTIFVNGLYRHGYLLAPTLVDMVVNVVNNDISMTEAANHPQVANAYRYCEHLISA